MAPADARGDFAIVYMEAEDPARLFGALAAGDTPYIHWFKQEVREIHGLDLDEPGGGLPSTLEFDWQENR